MLRRPYFFAVLKQCELVAVGLGGSGSTALEFKRQRNLHVVADARRGKIRPGVIFTHRHRSRRARRNDHRCVGASRSVIFLAVSGGLLAGLVLDNNRPIRVRQRFEKSGEIFRLDVRGRGYTTPIEIYEETPVGDFRRATALHAEKILIGDPVNMAQAMIASANASRLRGDWYWEAMQHIEASLIERLALLRSQKELAFSTDLSS
jgi:hypothetical protein